MSTDRDGLLFLDLRALMAAAYLDGIQHRPPVRPVTVPSPAPRLDDTGRAPLVPLRPAEGDAWVCGCVEPRRNHAAGWCHRA